MHTYGLFRSQPSNAGAGQSDITSLDREIKAIERHLKDYPDQEKRLISALRTGQFTQDYVLDEINRIKADRGEDSARLKELKQAKIDLSNLEKAEMKLSRFYAGVRERIEQCNNGGKRLAFEALALKVRATPHNVEITAVIPVDITTTQSSDSLLTTEQTSA
jgi:vacuolar-type H+-ATPase subunit I/STV1